jgi:hypothetical protein
MQRESRPGCELDRSQHVEQRLQLRGLWAKHPVDRAPAPGRAEHAHSQLCPITRASSDAMLKARPSYLHSQVAEGREDATRKIRRSVLVRIDRRIRRSLLRRLLVVAASALELLGAHRGDAVLEEPPRQACTEPLHRGDLTA